MIFGACALTDAVGAILAHSQRIGDRVLKKGTLLDRDALDALQQAGINQVIVARPEAGDVGENVAAERIGMALATAHVRPTPAFTGRVNLAAAAAGLLSIDTEYVHRLNMLDQAITLATLADASVVMQGEMIATIKIIPFAVSESVLAAADALLREAAPVLQVHSFRPLRTGLVLCTAPGLKDSVLEGTEAATQARITALGGTLLPARQAAHTEAAIADALRQLLDDGAELLLVAGAAAVADRHDIAPAAIQQAGGEILHFGMPVDPGNLLCLGSLRTCPAVILPGCARSPKLNGIDFVLRRIFAGLPVSSADIMRMGVGGLLKETDARPTPRAQVRHAQAPAHKPPPAVDALVLAAGRSQRMAPYNKLLLADHEGVPLIAHTVGRMLASKAQRVWVVVGHQEDGIRRALTGYDVRFVRAFDHAQGLSASLRAGIAALPADSDAALICLGDMPLVSADEVDALIGHFAPEENRAIIQPVRLGKRGNPVLFARRFYPEIMALSGDTGARHLLVDHAEFVADIEMKTDAVLQDFDTAQTLSALPWPVQMPGL